MVRLSHAEQPSVALSVTAEIGALTVRSSINKKHR
jgi:hypothetical protein